MTAKEIVHVLNEHVCLGGEWVHNETGGTVWHDGEVHVSLSLTAARMLAEHLAAAGAKA